VWLTGHLYQEIGEFAGLDFRTERRKIEWGAVVLATIFWVGLGWLAYHLVAIGYGWWAAFPAVAAFLFFVSTISLLTEKEQVVPQGGRGGRKGVLDKDWAARVARHPPDSLAASPRRLPSRPSHRVRWPLEPP
jgi:hypothetical protein